MEFRTGKTIVKYEILEDENGNRGLVHDLMTPGSACVDISLPGKHSFMPHSRQVIPMLVAFEIPENYHIQLYPRSSTFSKYGLLMPVSIIDSDYRKGIHAMLYNVTDNVVVLEKDTRIAQLLFVNTLGVEYRLVEKIEQTARGGLGSTGV
jgi:dUTP pyrophosphatase